MASKSFHPLRSLVRYLGAALGGRVHFPKDRLGESLVLEGETWVIFRQLVIDPTPGQPETPGAVFRPRFRVKGMSLKQNMLFSWLPIPFFAGLPGFRSKLWMVNEATGDSSGYYEWDTVEDAENYSRSFAMRFMTLRSEPGSVSFRVVAREQRQG